MNKSILVSASLVLLGLGSSAFAQPVDLGVIDGSNTEFGRSFGRLFGFGSPIGAFTDHYSFSIGTPSTATGGTIVLEFGSLDLSLTGISLSGGTLGSTMLFDPTPQSFSFSNLGVGSYTMTVAGRLNVAPGPIGFAQYSGFLSATTTSIGAPVPEANTYAMLALGLAGTWLLWRRRRPAAGTAAFA